MKTAQSLHRLALAGAALALPPAAAMAQATLPTVEISDIQGKPGATLDLDLPNSTASRLGLSARETPASVSTLSAADMAERNLTRAQDVAIQMPGVTQNPSPGNGGTGLVARGFNGHNSVAQMVDGTRLIVASGTITYPFSTWPLESVEVLRGPASVLYGDGAIGAAVNYVTKKPRFDVAEREAFVSGGSYGTVQGGVGLRGPINDVLAYSLYVDAAHSDGYRRDDGYERQNISAALAIRPTSALRIDLSLDAGHNDDSTYYGTPLRNGALVDSLRRTSFNVGDATVNYNDRMWRAKIDWQISDSLRLRNESYYLTSKRHWRNSESYAFNTAGTLVNRSDYLEILHDQEQTGNRIDLGYVRALAGLKNRFVIGLDYYRTKLLHTNNSPYGGTSTVDPFSNFAAGSFTSPVPTTPGRRSTLETAALFAEDSIELSPQWKLVAGLRRDAMDFDNQDLHTGVDLGKKYHPVTGRVGAVWTPLQDLSVYGQYGTGTDPLSGALSLPNGSSSYDLTRGRQLEFGLKGAMPAIQGEWTAAVYRIEKRNILSRDAINPLVTQQIGKQSSTGIELALAAEPLRNWTVDANAAFLRARYEDFQELVGTALVSRDGMVPTNVPERSANLWTGYRFTPQWWAGFGAQYVGQRYSNNANTTSLPAYTVLNASLAWRYSPQLTLSLAVNNLADRDYALSGTGNVRWLLGAPRTVQLTARARF
ncbi:TonB-dependent siderophore receptor [Xylophilus rhododendri]|uniref:TonB-dependent siderophore receptor n=1 Tax=Xylophilus rhododendri TaxID=2697032 RepID=A0A857JEI5_9BURK|nr:TonB-dependent siderophore receptor [Xylophilus rhododendri]QHJ01209.1 TonB-dependent siderophore receptor [Xylophilus rhododendri]